MGDRAYFTNLNSLYIRSKIWRRSLKSNIFRTIDWCPSDGNISLSLVNFPLRVIAEQNLVLEPNRVTECIKKPIVKKKMKKLNEKLKPTFVPYLHFFRHYLQLERVTLETSYVYFLLSFYIWVAPSVLLLQCYIYKTKQLTKLSEQICTKTCLFLSTHFLVNVSLYDVFREYRNGPTG